MTSPSSYFEQGDTPAGSSVSAIVVADAELGVGWGRGPAALSPICGRPMLRHVIDSFAGIPLRHVTLVVLDDPDAVAKELVAHSSDWGLTVIEHPGWPGDGRAVDAALRTFIDDPDEGDVVVIAAELPLLRAATIAALLAAHRESGSAATLLSAPAQHLPAADRIIAQSDGSVARTAPATAVEAGASAQSSPGVYCVRRSLLAPALRRIVPDRDTRSVRFADLFEVLADAGHRVSVFEHDAPEDVMAVVDEISLARARTVVRKRINGSWMTRGVEVVDPDNTCIDADTVIGVGVIVQPGSMLEGATVVGGGAEIGPGTRLVDCVVGARAVISHSIALDSEIGAGANVGPYAVLEQGSQIPASFVTGPFYHSTSSERPEV